MRFYILRIQYCLKKVLVYEITHSTVRRKYGEKKYSQIPSSLNEAFAGLASLRLTIDFRSNSAHQLRNFLADLQVPPDNHTLMTLRFPGNEAGSPIAYIYGGYFLRWLVNETQGNVSGDELTRKAVIGRFLDKYFEVNMDFNKAFVNIFNLTYQEAFIKFKEYFNEA